MTDRARPSPFAIWLAVLALVAFGLQVAGASWYDAHTHLQGDAVWYFGVARYLSDGRGFFALLPSVVTGHLVPSAAHPPLYPAFLSVPQVLGFHGLFAARVWSAVAGTATVVLLGLLTRDLAGEWAGLLAAAIAAVFVDLGAQSVNGWSEGLFACTIVLTVYASYRFLASPDVRHAAFLGLGITLAALTRAEALVLVPILLVPLVWRVRAPLARRGVLLASAGVVGVVLFAPWVAYNAGRFEHPVFVSTGLGPLLASSNCGATYRGSLIGGWGFTCTPNLGIRLDTDETVADAKMRHAGIEYARNHASRLPIVVPVRVLRTFGFYQPRRMTANDLELKGAARGWFTTFALAEYYALLVAGVAGLVVLHRRGVPVLPFLATAALVVVISVFGYGTMRFRIAFEAVLPALAAVALAQLFTTRVPEKAASRSLLDETRYTPGVR